MKLLRSARKLPRYVRRKRLAGGALAYFFEPPTWAREQECPVDPEPLGIDYDAAVRRAEDILLPAFDSWRTRGLSDMVPIGPAEGSFDWMVAKFKQQQKFKDTDRHTKRTYLNGTQLFADHVLMDGSRAGTKMVSDFSKGFVDAVFAKLLVVESVDAEGNVIRRERRRSAIAAMGACRRAWFVMHRAEEKIVPADNPFAKMGLKKLAPGERKKDTSTATWEELQIFRAEARRLGYGSLATAALTAWEWLQREEHLFGAFEIGHYRPKERPNSVCVVHPKTGEEAWWPLFDETGQELFPELMPELDAIKASMVSGLVFRRDHVHRKRRALLPWLAEKGGLDYLRATVKEILRSAGLREELSFTSFRHGGFTEGADSDLSDAELRAAGRHRSARQLPTYAKRTRKQLISGAQKRRATRTKPADLSE
jgi:hypothetical protein